MNRLRKWVIDILTLLEILIEEDRPARITADDPDDEEELDCFARELRLTGRNLLREIDEEKQKQTKPED